MGFSVVVENIFIIHKHNDGTYHFDYDGKGGFDDKHMGLMVFILNLIVIDENNENENFMKEKN